MLSTEETSRRGASAVPGHAGKVGIFLTTFNFLDKTRACLASFRRATGYPCELVAVDNHSTDGTLDFLRHEGVEVIANAAEVSLTQALNQGIQRFISDPEVRFIAWIHNDMRFFPGWLENLVRVVLRPEMGKLAPWNVSGDPARYDDAWAARFMAEHRDEFHPGNNCPWIMRREVVERVGLFDERFIKCGGWEDWDYNNRVIDCGYQVGTTGASVIWHEGMGTRNFVDNSDACQHNATVYVSKWGGRQPI